MNLLITGVNGDIGYSIFRILKNRFDIEILIGTDVTEYNLMGIDSKYYQVPHSSDRRNYLKVMKLLIEKHSIDLVIPSNEVEIITLKANLHLFNSELILLVQDLAVEKKLFFKNHSLVFLKSIGVQIADFFNVNEYDHSFHFPLYFKRNFSSGGEGVFLISDQVDLDYYKGKFPDSIVQENIFSKNEYTISVFNDGEDFKMIVFLRELGFGGLSKWVRVVDNSIALNVVKKINKSIDLVGSYNIQGTVIDGVFKVFEINMRISSTVSIRNLLGFKDLNWWIDLVCYNKKSVYNPPKVGDEVVRYFKEMVL